MKRNELILNVIAILFWVLIIGGILAVVLLMRHSAPCWIFPLAEAPTRCLPGATQ